MIRPGSRLDLKDHLVYTALVQELYEPIRQHIQTLKTRKDYAYLPRTQDEVPWFQQPAFRGWSAFRKVSIERIDSGVDTIIFSDISGFYENIDLTRLRHLLKNVGAPDDLLDALFKCLWVWAGPRGRGIPQGISASDLLAKLYLDGVDRRLERSGFEHIRYVDDYRVFCKSTLEAKRALMALTVFLRSLGLNVVTKKTEVLNAELARSRILGQIPKIEALTDELLNAVREEGFDAPYLSARKLPDLETDQARVSKEVLEQAFRESYLVAPHDDSSWDSALFHYILRRLGPLGSKLAIDYCVELLDRRPEETDYVLEYIAFFVDDEETVRRVVEFASSTEAIYDYQVYQIVRWIFEKKVTIPSAIQLCRNVMGDKARSLWLRSFALATVGAFGDATDLDAIEELYASADSDLERAIILCGIKKMSVARRNSVYARHQDGGILNSVAVRWSKETT